MENNNDVGGDGDDDDTNHNNGDLQCTSLTRAFQAIQYGMGEILVPYALD